MSDLIRRIDAMQACQVAPSDEWSKATKGGYNQAATDCAMALLKCEPVPPTLSAALEALAEIGAVVTAIEGADSLDKEIIRNIRTRIAALTPTADKEPKT